MDTLFTLAALIGGAVLLFQFGTMLLGMTDHGGGDLSAGDGGDLGGVGHVGGDLSHDMPVGADATHVVVDHGGVAYHIGAWFYEVLSIRTLSAALAFFGLVGKTAQAYDYSPLGSLTLATIAGLGAMYAVYWLFKQVYKLQHSGTENIRNAVGAPAVVYVPIPANRTGAGKVTFRLQNRLVEYQAVTEDETRLATGEKVVVVAVVNAETVRVARAEPAANVAPPATKATSTT